MAKRATKTAPFKQRKRHPAERHFIVKLRSYEGDDTACYLLGADPMWIVVSVSDADGGAVIDYGYRSLEEARAAWPNAIPPPDRRPSAPRLDVARPVFSEPWFQDAWRKMKAALAPSNPPRPPW